jgi:hypothetical protein
MRRRKVDLQVRGRNDVYSEGILRITKEETEYFFEIGNEMTSDPAEAVAIMMRKIDWNSPAWDIQLGTINIEEITPEKTLFWLTGGYGEWRTLINYNRPWCDAYIFFQEEFGQLIVNIVDRSKSLKEIRNHFANHLRLEIIYEFAL